MALSHLAQAEASFPAENQLENVIINEVGQDGRIELFNGTAGAVDVSDYWLCNFPAYRRIGDATNITVESGNLLIQPGEYLVVSGFSGFDADDAELGLYLDNSFSNAGSLVSYLEYGSSGHRRSGLAIANGIWSNGFFLTAPTAAASIQTFVDASDVLSWSNEMPTFGAENEMGGMDCNITTNDIMLEGGGTETSICVDGNGDPLTVINSGGTGDADATGFIITNTDGLILGLPVAGPFDLDGAGAGTCEIWYIRYQTEGFSGREVGNNLSDLSGCFDLSNAITVVRQVPDGGTLALAEGGTDFIGCAGDIVFDVAHTTTATALSYWYVITDDNNNILGFHNSADGPTLDLSGAPAGTCRIWGWSYRGLPDPVVGEPLSSIAPDGSCADISDEFITVYRETPDGGTITTAGGSSDTTVVAGNAFVTVMHSTTAQFLSYYYVITDDNDNILAFQNSTAGNTLNLSGAPAGTCRIWGWSYRGLPDPVAGQNISTLNDDFCETISDGFVTVVREEDPNNTCDVDGGNIYTDAQNVQNFVVVANRSSASISAINADNNELIGNFPMPNGGQPMYVVHNPTNNTVLVGDYEGRVIAFDASNFSVKGEVSVGDGIFHMWMNPEGSQLWTNNELDRNISVVNPTTLEVLNTVDLPTDLFELGYRPHDIIFSPDGNTAFVTLLNNLDQDFVIRYNVADFTETHRVGVGLDPHVTLTPNNDLLYVAAQFTSELTIFNRSDLSEVTRLNIPAAHGLGMSPNGDYLYIGNISNGGDSAIYTLELATNTLIGEPTDAPATVPHNLAVFGNQLYLTHSSAANNIVSIYNLTPTPVQVATITVENNPFGLVAYSATTATEISICIDGNADPIEVTRDGTSQGDNRTFVITDDLGNILAIPQGNGPFDLDPAGPGTCEIWYLAYEDGLEGLMMGNNLSDLNGCFDLSNAITVVRQVPDGGTLALAEGGTDFIGCAGDIVFDVAHTTTATALSYWYVITDDNNNILGFHNAADGPTLDLSGAPAGTCRIWGWSYRGLPDPVVGEPLSSIAPDGSCADISDEFITVYRETPDGGTITTAGGSSDTTVVAGNAFVTVAHTTTAQFLSYYYVITDDNDNILAFQNAADGNTLNLSGAPAGTCRIWGWSYRGLPDPVAGENISTLNDDFCETISDGFVTVVREDCNITTNDIMLEGGGTETSICVDGNGDPLTVITGGGTGDNDATGFIITNTDGLILGLPAAGPFDLDGAGAGTCEIWYIRYQTEGFSGREVGNNLSDLNGCFDLSNAITVVRQVPDGGTLALAEGGTDFIGCAGDIVFDVAHTTTATALSYWYVITDDNNNILGFHNAADGPTLDLSGAPAGTCRIWGWSYRGLPDPVVGEPLSSIAPDGSCADISDEFITVYRETPDGGTITTAGGSSDTTVVAGNAFVTVAHTTTAQFLSYYYVITDDNDNILAFQNAADGNTLNLSGAPAGTCRIWGWSYRGLPDPVAGENISTLNDDFCETISDGFVTVVREDCNITTNDIMLEGGGTETSICVDGNGDPLTVITGGGTGDNDATGFIITNTDGLILGLPAAGPFDLDGAGAGTCEIWYIRYQTEGFSGREVGNNLSDLTGCFDLSNAITVVRQVPDGGTLALAEGGTNFIGCAGDIVFDVAHTTTATALSYWYVITDDNNNILGFHNSADGPTLDLSGAPAGTCRIWGWSYRGLPDPVVGEPLSSIAPDGSCADISDEFITVYRETPDGGTITTAGGSSDTTVVAGNAFVTVAHTTTAQFLSYYYVITDDNDNILAFQNAADGNTLNLSGAPAGTCRIWGWSYRGLPDPVAGQNISTLNDDFCETISEAFVTVVREDCNITTNDIMLEGGGTETSICVDGNGDPLTVITGGGTGDNDATGFIITNTDGLILGLPAAGPFDLDGAGAGTCEIWYIRYQTEGFSGREVGNNLSDLNGCFDLSNAITVVRQVPDGGTLALAQGGTDFIGCAGDIVFDVAHTTTATALSYWYVITDDNNNILGFHNSADGPTLDLSGAPAGTCRIWGWSYRGLPDPVVGEPLSSIAPDGSCADISDEFITVYRETPDGGTVTTAGGSSDTTVVAGNAFVTVAHTTTAQFLSYYYVITDDNDNILAFQNAADGNTLNLSGAPAGTCRIWGWSYRGLPDPVAGENISTLNDDFCETISDGFVSVVREAAAFEYTDVIINEVGQDGRIEFYNGTDAAIDVTNYWLCNFPTYAQLSSLTLECGELVMQPGDYLVISGFSGFNATDAEVGLYTTNSFGNSDAIVSYLEYGSAGHMRSSVAVAAGIWTADFFLEAPNANNSIQTFEDGNSLTWGLYAPTFCAENELVNSTDLLGLGVELNVFPNPSRGRVTVALSGLQGGDTEFTVFDQVGRVMFNQQISAANGRNEIDLGNVPSGTYLLRISNGRASTTQRLTVL